MPPKTKPKTIKEKRQAKIAKPINPVRSSARASSAEAKRIDIEQSFQARDELRKTGAHATSNGVKKKLPKKEEKAAVVKEEMAPPAVKPATEETRTPAENLPEENGGRYWEAVGRRKTAVARVRLFTKGEKGMWVNGKEYKTYFQYPGLFLIPEDPLKKMKSFERFRVTAHINGGGMHAQAEAFRHGISRALVKFNQDFRKRLKRAGFLTRDSRMKERKKFGLKGARRAPQWQKR